MNLILNYFEDIKSRKSSKYINENPQNVEIFKSFSVFISFSESI